MRPNGMNSVLLTLLHSVPYSDLAGVTDLPYYEIGMYLFPGHGDLLMRQLRIASLVAICSPLFFVGSSLPGQTGGANGGVNLKVVKYADLGKEVRKNLGKVVVVDFWATN
jgi:hypothetical protein